MSDAATIRSFVPFIVEATGRLGTRARRFLEGLQDLCKSSENPSDDYPDQRWSFFRRELGTVIATWNARMVCQLRESCTMARSISDSAISSHPSSLPPSSSRPASLFPPNAHITARQRSAASSNKGPRQQSGRGNRSSNKVGPSRNTSATRPTACPQTGRRADICSANSCLEPLQEFCFTCKKGFCKDHLRAPPHPSMCQQCAC